MVVHNSNFVQTGIYSILKCVCVCVCACGQLAELEHRCSVLESENRSLHGRLEGSKSSVEKSISVSLHVFYI